MFLRSMKPWKNFVSSQLNSLPPRAMKTAPLPVKPDYPNIIKKTAHDFGCFLSADAVEAARICGVLKKSFPAGIKASEKYHCKLLVDLRDVPLFIAELKNGTDENVFRNMAAALFQLPA